MGKSLYLSTLRIENVHIEFRQVVKRSKIVIKCPLIGGSTQRYESFVNVSKWMGTNCEIVGEKRELLVLELAVGKYIEQQQQLCCQSSRAEIARASSQNGTESRDRLDTLIYDTVMHNRHCLMGALLCFLSLSLCSRSSPLRYFQQRKNPAASAGPPEYKGLVGTGLVPTKQIPKSSQKAAINGPFGQVRQHVVSYF